MTGRQIPIGHIDWVKVVMYAFQDFCPTYGRVYIVPHNVSHSTQRLYRSKISICLHALRLKPVNIVPESGSNATTAHGANHIGTSCLADAVNYPRGESPNCSVGRRGSSNRETNYGLSSRNSLPIFRLRRYECPACSCCSVARVWCSWET
jgi:hypothetical protein